MRVLHATPDISPSLGGTTTHALELCRALSRKGVSLTLACTNLDEVGSWRPGYRPRTIEGSTAFTDGIDVRYFAASWPSRFAFSPDMNRYLAGHIGEYDLVHVHRLYRFTTLAATWHARRAKIPYVVSPHGVLHPFHRRRRRFRKQLYDLLEGRNLKHAAAIHYTSSYELNLAKPLQLAAPPVVIPNGINPTDFERLPLPGSFRRTHPELAGKKLVVFVGRLAPQKGLDLLIEAFSVVAKAEEDAHLVITGPDQEGHLRMVSKWIRRLGLQARTTITGPLYGSDKLELLVDTDVWVLPSYAENFGIAVLEALAARLPVVITDRVGIQEHIVQANAGIVVSCRAGELAQAILATLSDKGLSRSLAEAGQQLAFSRFTWDAAAGQMIELYRALVASGPAVCAN